MRGINEEGEFKQLSLFSLRARCMIVRFII